MTPTIVRLGAWREFYTGLRNQGIGWFASGVTAAIWWLFGVEIEEDQ